jgi:hypothetical protein
MVVIVNDSLFLLESTYPEGVDLYLMAPSIRGKFLSFFLSFSILLFGI